MPEISVCIPSYNYAEYLGACIESILAQDFSDFEIIVTDDASTDDSEALMHRYADPRIRFYRHPQRVGMVNNWNSGIVRAKGRYISVLHADDVMLPGMLRSEREVLEKYPRVGMVFAATQIINSGGAPAEIIEAAPNDFVRDGHACFADLIQNLRVRTPSVMVRRECYERLGTFDPRLKFTVDLEMWLRIAAHYDIAYIARPLAAHRLHARNETKKFLMQVSDLLDREQAIEIAFGRLPISATDLRALKPLALRATAERAVDLIEALLRAGQPELIPQYAQLAAHFQARSVGESELPAEAVIQLLAEVAARNINFWIKEYEQLRDNHLELLASTRALEKWSHELNAIVALRNRELAQLTGFLPIRWARALRRRFTRQNPPRLRRQETSAPTDSRPLRTTPPDLSP